MKISLRTSATPPVGDNNNNNNSPTFVCTQHIASTAVTSGLLYRYNEDKTLSWLKKKVLVLFLYTLACSMCCVCFNLSM